MGTSSFEYTPTWVVALVCLVIVVISSLMERGIHRLGKLLKKQKQNALFEALQKLKDELMLLGFISFLLTVFQGAINRICIPITATDYMLPCVKPTGEVSHYQKAFSGGRRLLAGSVEDAHCQKRGLSPLLSLEALHQLHIFIFVLAIVHVIFSATTMALGGIKIREWKQWEDRQDTSKSEMVAARRHGPHYHAFVMEHAYGFWSKFGVLRWTASFGKQFCASVSKTDYIALRGGFIMEHCPAYRDFDFHKYMMRALEDDFKRVVGIRWYLWVFVIVYLLVNVSGWHTFFWLSFLPLILLLAVGAKLEHIIIQLAKEVAQQQDADGDVSVKPSDDHFWFKSPNFVLYLIHFILFQNAFEIAIFFWILATFGFRSCLMERVAYMVPRVIIGIVIQVLCSYSTLPLYAIVTQMGSMYKAVIFEEHLRGGVYRWAAGAKKKPKLMEANDGEIQKLEMAMETWNIVKHDGASTAADETVAAITIVPDKGNTDLEF